MLRLRDGHVPRLPHHVRRTVLAGCLLAGLAAVSWPAPAEEAPLAPGIRAPAASAQGDGELTGLDDCIRYAVANSPALEAAYQRWRAAVERVPQATALPDPRLGIGIVFDQVDDGARRMGERYSISQTFPWFGKLALRGDMAEQGALAEARRYESARLELVERVTRAWFEYAWLHGAAAIARENRDLVLRLEAVSRARYRAGSVTQADVNRAQVALGHLDDQVRALEDLHGPARAELNAAMGRSALAPLPAAPPPPSAHPLAELPRRDDAEWLALARAHNPDLQAARHQLEGDARSIELARRNFYPDITLGVEYARDAASRMARMDGGGSDMVVGMVGISVPLWRSRYAAGVREAEARTAASTEEVDARALGLEAAVQRALFSYRDGGRRLELYGATLLPTARQAVLTTEAAYRAGGATFSDLVDTQRVLLEFELARERAAADRAAAAARIRTLVGADADGGTP
jgi:outer membrane protein, heavy metal efflux system